MFERMVIIKDFDFAPLVKKTLLLWKNTYTKILFPQILLKELFD
jgi:hypothetical protein